MSEALAIMPRIYPVKTTTEDLIDRFTELCSVKGSTMKGYAVCLNAFSRWAQENGIEQPTRADIRDYVRFLDSSGLKPSTRAQYFRVLKHMFDWATAEGLCPLDVTHGINGTWKIDKKHSKKQALSRIDVQKIAATIDRESEQGKRLYAMFLLGIIDGLRTIEISRANIEDIKTIDSKAYLYVWGKGHSEPDAPVLLPAEVQEALQLYIKSRTDNPTGKSPLFVSTSNRSKGKRISPTTISTILKDMLKGAGYDSDRLTAHSLRHTSGTGVYKITKNLYLTQLHQRHANPETTEIYIHAEDREERDTEQRVYNYYFNPEAADDPQHEAISIIQGLSPDKLEKALSILRAIQ